MRRIWLVFAQTVTVCLAILFVVVTLRPEWLQNLGTENTAIRPDRLESKRVAAPTPPLSTNPGVIAQPSVSQSQAPGSYADAVARAAPAVVNIYTTKRVEVSRLPFPPDPLLRHFFEQMPGFRQQQQSTNLGSGVIVSANGHVVTNFHVVEEADEIVVALRDGRQSAAKIIGIDPESDLAVLKIPLADLPVLPFDVSSLPRVGDVVLAIGNPFGVGQTVTMGVVSALGRGGLGINTYENFIQTDAAINPGNSGGALIDTLGRLIGINTAIYSKSGGSLGIGFAIPAEAAQKVLLQIIKDGFVRRGWLGIETQDVTPDLAKAFKLERPEGVIVASMMREGPGAKGGLRIGDIIQSFDGEPVVSTARLMAAIAAKSPDSRATLKIYRSGRTQTLNVTLGQRPVRPR
ncbi:S1C family serine protease [Zwartia vadi]|uniref:S1C family serine protease n=1 Tax=Zwartia vadi TaxID=3058168 RepID=UPI0025B42517|nr:trypsin-like peptidase domain-containing protein [Zwartia vadi]MDN3987796.1 trypsin-like peptidase domain-containing protein [Zwartia vadi]